jgi:hypothetical protein
MHVPVVSTQTNYKTARQATRYAVNASSCSYAMTDNATMHKTLDHRNKLVLGKSSLL